MKRLTEPRGFVNGIACQERGVELYWRLKQYEDIGLDPEEIKNLLEHLEIEAGQLRQELAELKNGLLLQLQAERDALHATLKHYAPCEECGHWDYENEICISSSNCIAGELWTWRGEKTA